MIIPFEHNGWVRIPHDEPDVAKFEKMLLGHKVFVYAYFRPDCGPEFFRAGLDEEEAFLIDDGLPPGLIASPEPA
jgi:hypothetical protein